MIAYTGHPLVDVGAATVTAFSQKRRPEEVTEDDLLRLAQFLEEQYQRKYLTGYLTCVFPNSAYVNPTSGPEKKRAFLDAHLRSFLGDPDPDAGLCGICGKQAAVRGFRQHVPMITGEGVINFFPNGRPGLPLCSGCMISLATLPLGALRCGGRALIAHADDPELTYRIASANLKTNRALLQLQDLAADAKYPDAKQPRTRLLESLREWASEEASRFDKAGRGRAIPTSLTAYHLTNSGQGPDLTIYHLPASTLAFLVDAEAAPFRQVWHSIIRSAWRSDEKETEQSSRRNYLYDDFFRLPDEWGTFVRTYFLRRAFKAIRTEDTSGTFILQQDIDLVNWSITALFLKGVLGMDEHRVKTIREFGDRIAAHISERDPGFWRSFHFARFYGTLRVNIINASKAEEKAGRPPLIGFDDFITIFESGEEVARPDWRLARDLVLIRVIEQLYEWFKLHPEALSEGLTDDESLNESSEPSDVIESPSIERN